MTQSSNSRLAPTKPAARIDFGIERDRHRDFIGRAALLARLDQMLLIDQIDRWVVVTGGPGMGKSALLARWLALREAAGVLVPHHFIRRGEYEWDDPARLVGSLVAQIEERFPVQREPADHAQLSPASRLVAMLRLVSASELVPRGERLVVLIDGLDEYDAAPGTTGDPLTAFLPHALPAGVSFLCASRPHQRRPRRWYGTGCADRDGARRISMSSCRFRQGPRSSGYDTPPRARAARWCEVLLAIPAG